GAKAERMAAIAAAGFTSDHEPITAAQVLERARQGISVMLRESSLRPDLVGLLDALKAAPALVSRLMLTCDGSMPAFIEANGFMDHAVRLALDRGVPPIDAYRMATLNAATYYGLDADLGAVAPGRYADVCVLRDLAEPRPEMVIAGGRVAADRDRLQRRRARARPGGDGARGEPPARPPRRYRRGRPRRHRVRARASDRWNHDARHARRRGALGARVPRGRGGARLSSSRAGLHALLPGRRLLARRPAHAPRRVGREADAGVAAGEAAPWALRFAAAGR